MYEGIIETQISSIRNEAESNKSSMEQVESDADDKIRELSHIKDEASDVAGELEDYITNLDGLVALIEKAERVVDDAQGQGIDI